MDGQHISSGCGYPSENLLLNPRHMLTSRNLRVMKETSSKRVLHNHCFYHRKRVKDDYGDQDCDISEEASEESRRPANSFWSTYRLLTPSMKSFHTCWKLG
ncbi:hypothetical protein LIER_31075 [Lithospermum erythrorhizon]|uniref:Uncharacterized protein n=1 Tax=Lithospermum erythrorhizon TaxID=34254 RepID=A0AAV3RTD4_LITER